MGVMNKLRENTGAILWLLVFAFGVIWVLQDSGGFDVIGTVGTTVAEVNGDPIAYDAYMRAVNAQIDNEQNRTGDAVPPQRVDQIRDQVFNALVEDQLRQQEMDRLGLAVTDEELLDMVVGDNPHPLISVYFSDGQGGVDRALLQNFIDNPDARAQWIQLEEFLRTQRRQEKLDKLIESVVRISDADVQSEYVRRNKSVDVRFVALRYASVPDDSISVTDSDLRSYYNAHRDDYERKRTYTLAFVGMSKLPNASDTTNIMNDLAYIREGFATTTNDSTFLARNASDRPFTRAFFRRDELGDAVADSVYADLTVGRIVGPLFEGNDVHLVKIVEVRDADEEVIHARHILFRAPEGDEAARAEALQRANDVLGRIRDGEDFAELARTTSDDRANAPLGGDLGWFNRERMVEPFSDAAFGASVGRVVGPVATSFGYHLIEVLDRADKEVMVADYTQRIRPSVATLNEVEETLDDLQYYAGESGDFDAEAQRRGLTPQSFTVEADQEFLPGLGNSRSLTNFLETASVGDVTEVIELDDQFIVATVTDIQEEGYRPFDEVRNQVEARVKTEKKKAVQRARMERAYQTAGGFDGLAGRLNEGERTAQDLKLNNPVVPGLGRDPNFVGTAFGLEEGQDSGIVEGENAVFVLKVTGIEEPAEMTEEARETLRSQLLNQRRTQVRTQWITTLHDEADIADNRRRFLQ